MAEPIEGTVRGVWPDRTATMTVRARQMLVEYREQLKAQTERANALQAALAEVGLQALRSTNPGLAERIVGLLDTGPDPVTELDTKFADYGETWHLEKPIEFSYDDSDWIPSRLIKTVAGISDTSLVTARMEGRIPGQYLGTQIGFVYQLGEVRKLKASMPGRGRGGGGSRPRKSGEVGAVRKKKKK